MPAAASPGARHLLWIEAARTIAMLVVVWSHASNTAFFREGDFSVTPLFSSCLVTFAVPAFFLLSGYLLSLHACLRPSDVPFSRRPAKQIKRLLPPFLAWNALTLLALKGLCGVPLLHWQRLLELVVGCMQLYFIFAMLQLLALARLTDLFASTRRIAGWTLAGLASTLAFYALSSILVAVSPPRDYVFELVGIRLAPAWAFFFFLGAYLARREDILAALTRRLPLLTIATALAFALYLYEVNREVSQIGGNYRQYFLLSGLVFQVLGTLTLCCACRVAERRGGGRLFAALAATGRDTLGIYLSHYILVLAFYALIPPPVAPAWRLPLGAACLVFAFGGSLIFTRLARRAGPRLWTRLLLAGG